MIFWNSPLKAIQKFFFHTPLVNLFVFASAAYHDMIWYTTAGKKVVNKWLAESQWGELFKEY